MAFDAYQVIAINLYTAIRDAGLQPPDVILLFGSHATKSHRLDSDIDIALVGKYEGKTIELLSQIQRIAVKIHPDLEIVLLETTDFLDSEPISPIAAQIKEHGVTLL